MTSKLDPHRKARDHRKDDRERKKRKRHREEKPTVHVDVTSVIFTSQQPDAESRIVVLDALPDMEDVWIDKVVYLRQPGSGAPDRAFIGTQYLDDSLAWIELTLATPAVGGSSAPDPGEPEVATWVRRFAAGSLGASDYYINMGIDYDGTFLWVADRGNDRAAKFNVGTGAFVSATSGTAPTFASGLAFNSSDGRLYVVDRVIGNARVRTYAASTGAFVASIRNDPEWEGQQELLDGIAINAAATQLAVAVSRGSGSYPNDYGRVHKVLISSGAITNEYSDTTYYPYPVGIDYDTTGNLYVASPGGSSEFTEGHRLTKLSTTGAVLNSVGGFAGTASGKFNSPQGVCVDRTNNRVYVADSNNHRVQIFDTNLDYLGKFGSGPGNGTGQLYYPSDMALIGTSLYVVCNGLSTTQLPSVTEWTINL